MFATGQQCSASRTRWGTPAPMQRSRGSAAHAVAFTLPAIEPDDRASNATVWSFLADESFVRLKPR